MVALKRKENIRLILTWKGSVSGSEILEILNKK